MVVSFALLAVVLVLVVTLLAAGTAVVVLALRSGGTDPSRNVPRRDRRRGFEVMDVQTESHAK